MLCLADSPVFMSGNSCVNFRMMTYEPIGFIRTLGKYFFSIMCRNHVDSMESAWRVILYIYRDFIVKLI